MLKCLPKCGMVELYTIVAFNAFGSSLAIVLWHTCQGSGCSAAEAFCHSRANFSRVMGSSISSGPALSQADPRIYIRISPLETRIHPGC